MKIEYPIEWKYKVIGKDRDILIQTIDRVLDNREYRLQNSKTSSKGKYISLQVSTIVQSEEERNTIFQNLQKEKDIFFVI